MREEDFRKYLSDAYTLQVSKRGPDGSKIESGTLTARTRGRVHEIRHYIPRFVPTQNYADNFGLQWNEFRSTQLDSKNGKDLSAKRFWSGTKWKPEELEGRRVLEAGSGAGRFTEILLNAGADVVSFDYSSAVDANYANNDHPNLFLFQGDIYDLPLKRESFDYVFCYGVLQHTPDAQRALYTLLEFLKPGGRFSFDHYLKARRPSPWSTPKYLWRPITSRMRPETLMKCVRFYVPRWLPIDTFIRTLPFVGPDLISVVPVPCWNYVNLGLSEKERVEWAIMDTFDALAPAHDVPRTREEIARWCEVPYVADVEVFLGGNGVIANGWKSQAAAPTGLWPQPVSA